MTGVLVASLLAGLSSPAGAWIDVNLLCRHAAWAQHHGGYREGIPWRMKQSGTSGGVIWGADYGGQRYSRSMVAVSMSPPHDGGAGNETVNWVMGTQLTKASQNPRASGGQSKQQQQQQQGGRRKSMKQQQQQSGGWRGSGSKQGHSNPQGERKGAGQGRQQKAELGGGGVNMTSTAGRAGPGADRRKGRFKTGKRGAEAMKKRRSGSGEGGEEEEEEAAVSAPPPLSLAMQEQGEEGEEGMRGGGEEGGAGDGTKSPGGRSGFQQRGFGKKKPPPSSSKKKGKSPWLSELKSELISMVDEEISKDVLLSTADGGDGGGGGGVDSPEFAKVVKFLSIRPKEYAMAKEILEEIFGPNEVGPWLAELETAAKSESLKAGAKGGEKEEVVVVAAEEEVVEKKKPQALVEEVVMVEGPVMEEEGGEEITLPVEKLGLKRRGPRLGAVTPPSSPPPTTTMPDVSLIHPGQGQRIGEVKRVASSPPPPPPPPPPPVVMAEERVVLVDEEEEGEADGGAAPSVVVVEGGDEEEMDDEEDDAITSFKEVVVGEGEEEEEEAEGVGGTDESVIRDKRVVSTNIKDAKLTEYIKEKKNAKIARDKLLADMGVIRSAVHPPQRFVEVYYNNWADDFYTVITTSSNRFGPRWWFREALSHSPSDVMAWLRTWYRMAKKHGVLHDSVAAMLSEAFWEDGGLSEAARFNALKEKMRRWREPRIIAIGDVHGCIDELRALLTKVEYSPADLIIFLGDMVAKGPDSVEVVRLAREIGALSVRGNHENEVIRWSRAMAFGVQSNFKSEHYLIAMGLSEEDMEWLKNLPWYISCSDMQLLFVHAGFVSNLRLSKQHPRFMMNMRSILADGTVSARYYQDYPWARTWQGPQTVLFGHDARRGMQAYDQALGLDTGCVYGGNLTACLLPGKEVVQVEAAEPYIVNRYERILRRAEVLRDSRSKESQQTTIPIKDSTGN